MADSQMTEAMHDRHGDALPADMAGATEGQLLQRFIERRDEAAFEVLVRLHGPMVLGVCRRILCSHHDAEDALQVVFLSLARNAALIAARETMANWLYRVALRTAVKAKRAAARRRAKETPMKDLPEPAAVEQKVWLDLQPLLDQELIRLPETYRAAIVLCDLEGRPRKEAALQLGWPAGTLAVRLMRARELLSKRLARRGLVLSAATLTLVLSQNAASAALPASLAVAVAKAASAAAVVKGVSAGTIATKTAAWAKGMLKSLSLTKVAVTTVALAAVAVVSVAPDPQPAPTPQTWKERFLAEYPAAEKRLEEVASHLQMKAHSEDTLNGKTRVSEMSYYGNGSEVRVDEVPLPGTPGRTSIWVATPSNSFVLRGRGGNAYELESRQEKTYAEFRDAIRSIFLLPFASVGPFGSTLTEQLAVPGFTITTVEEVNREGQTLVKVSWTDSSPKELDKAGSVLLWPEKGWVVKECSVKLLEKKPDRDLLDNTAIIDWTVEYDGTFNGVPIPQKFTREFTGTRGSRRTESETRLDVTYKAAPSETFQLSSFEIPGRIDAKGARKTSWMLPFLAVNIVLLLLVLAYWARKMSQDRKH